MVRLTSVRGGVWVFRAGRVPAELDVFVGRSDEVRTVETLLGPQGPARLVTIAGTGGVGKTRLALRVAARAAARHREQDLPSVAIVDLRSLADVARLPEEITTAVGVLDSSCNAPLESVVARLGPKRMLLVLDNCEHLSSRGVGEVVTALLEAAPGLRVLATSRVALGVRGEHHLPLDPLGPTEAFSLFAARAAQADARINPELHREAIVELCARVAGIPMLVEITAAQLRHRTPAEVLASVDTVLTTEATTLHGHQLATYEQVMQVSWSLAGDQQRRCWQQLAVFVGGVTEDGARSVCASDAVPSTAVAGLLRDLVEQSILRRDPVPANAPARYSMLEPVREYAMRRARDAGIETVLRNRHQVWVREVLEEAAVSWLGPDEVWWLERVRAELPNARAALDHSWHGGRASEGIRIAVAVFRARVPFVQGALGEWGRYQLERFLPQYRMRDSLRAQLLAAAAYTGFCQGAPEASALLEEARAIADERGVESATVLQAAGVHLCFGTGDPRCVDLLERAIEVYEGMGEQYRGDRGICVMWLAISAAIHAPVQRAVQATQDYLDHAGEYAAPYHLSWAGWARAVVLWRIGDIGEAEELMRESVSLQRDIGDRWGPVWWVAVAGWLATATGQDRRAAQLCGAVARVMELTGIRMDRMAGVGPWAAQNHRVVRARLGVEDFDREWEVGYRIDGVDGAVELVLGGSDGRRRGRLTPREAEIAGLLSRGSTNAAIAEQLVISPATVHSHVKSVFAKLGVRSRRQVGDALAGAATATGGAGTDHAGR